MANIAANYEAELQPDRRTILYERPLLVLTLRQIHQIDDALAELGPHAEVGLIKESGKFRFITKTERQSAI